MIERSRLLVTVRAEHGLRQATVSLIMTLGKKTMPPFQKIIWCIGLAAVAVGATAGVLFTRGKSRAISAIPPELAAELLHPHWNGAALSASSLKFHSAKFSDHYTIVTYFSESPVASEQESAFLFRFAKIGNEPTHLADITKVAPFSQNLVIWTADNQK